MKSLVIGSGSIAQRHIKNLISFGHTPSFLTNSIERLNIVSKLYPITGYLSIDEALDHNDTVIIANPTHLHEFFLYKSFDKKKHVYIEKPISNTLKNLPDLLQRSTSLTVEVGCQMRSSRNLRELKRRLNFDIPHFYSFAMGQSLDQWRPNSDFRNSYSANSIFGGGAMLDLIHTVDMSLFLFGKIKNISVISKNCKKHNIKADEVSIMNVIHESGVIGQIQNDMISPSYRGRIEVIAEEHIYTYSMPNCSLSAINSSDKSFDINVDKHESRDQMFKDHMSHFFSRISNKAIPARCSFADGAHALDALLSADILFLS